MSGKTEKVFLIGGAPVVGKTSLARKLSEDVGLPWISTDTIRSLMQRVVRKEDYPALFYPSMSQAKDYLADHGPKEIIDDQNSESLAVWQGVQGILGSDYPWKSYIIEGVAVLPKLVNEAMGHVDNICPMFLYEDRKERIRKVIFERGLWDDADKCSNELKEKEVSWVVMFNKFIKEEAAAYGFPLIEYKDNGSHVKTAKLLCGQ